MNYRSGVSAHGLFAAFGVLVSVAMSCGDGDSTADPSGRGAAPAGGTMSKGGESSGGTAGRGGTGTAGDGGAAGESGAAGAECVRDGDCVPIGECYSASCDDGSCVGAASTRGSECSDGFCNGFARCLPCLNDAPGAERDTGCSEDSPVCAETASEPACGGCTENSHCNDGVECTVDRCADSECENAPLPSGSSCSLGVCNGEAGEDSCRLCVDDASFGVDTGCTRELPRCDASQSPAACTFCLSESDCNDDNDCTSDGCREGVCENATLLNGTPCSLGYCNGVSGLEACIFKPCQTAVDCDDLAACTGEVCRGGSCVYATNDDQCPSSGDVCKPNVCTVGTGCQQIDTTRTLELLRNGSLDAGNVDWVEWSMSYGQVIYPYDYVPTLKPHTELYIAWLGGGEGLHDERNSLSQTVRVPTGAVRLELAFFYQITTEELPEDHNYLRVNLRSADADPSEGELVTFHNQDRTKVWTRFSATVDAAAWVDSDVVLEFTGIAIDGFTNFYVDTISLVATVCD